MKKQRESSQQPMKTAKASGFPQEDSREDYSEAMSMRNLKLFRKKDEFSQRSHVYVEILRMRPGVFASFLRMRKVILRRKRASLSAN